MGFDPWLLNAICSGRQRLVLGWGWKSYPGQTIDSVSDLLIYFSEDPILARFAICRMIHESARDDLTN
jgi:hypothetical protein